MTTEIKIGLWIASLVAVLGILFGAYHYGRTAQKMADDNAHNIEQIAIAKVIQNQAAANDALKTQLGVQHEKDTAALDALRHPNLY
jgi:predicted histidine transporter YuiF (NhaC family)